METRTGVGFCCFHCLPGFHAACAAVDCIRRSDPSFFGNGSSYDASAARGSRHCGSEGNSCGFPKQSNKVKQSNQLKFETKGTETRSIGSSRHSVGSGKPLSHVFTEDDVG